MRERASDLAEDVRAHGAAGESSGRPKADGDGGVEVRPGDVSNRVNHCHDNQAKSQGDARVSNCAAADFIDNDGSGSGKDQGERSESFGDIFFHRR